MGHITQKEMECLEDLQAHADKAFKSKGVLKTMSRLADNGLIEWSPLAGTVKLTDAGLSAISNKV